jgi:predicted glycogen debranching enzyme
MDRAADSYLVKRGKGKTIVAGYPWFTDWGRDTFISLRGLCLATGRLEDARDILLEWSNVVSEGMLPNLFPDQSDRPEYNSVDASLWYIIAIHDFLAAMRGNGGLVSLRQKKSLHKAIDAILTGYSQGTRYGIRMDQDGLLTAGVPGVQLTWMDAKVGDWVVTPRIGKPVEVEALWLNALWIGSQFNDRWKEPLERGLDSFRRRFWNSQDGSLFDVVDSDHQPGKLDASFRPNQIFAVGGLPLQVINGEQAARIVDGVEHRLWTPLGLRSLAPGEPGYTAHYQGGVRERDGVYHQGTVWPWLIGAFVEAWVRVRSGSADAKREARLRFVTPLIEHLNHAGLGHVSEIADADQPYTPRGCPFQAWSLAELLRLDRGVLA